MKLRDENGYHARIHICKKLAWKYSATSIQSEGKTIEAVKYFSRYIRAFSWTVAADSKKFETVLICSSRLAYKATWNDIKKTHKIHKK